MMAKIPIGVRNLDSLDFIFPSVIMVSYLPPPTATTAAAGPSTAGRATHAGRTTRTAGACSAATHAGRCSTKRAPVRRTWGIRDLSIANAIPSTSSVVRIATPGTTVGRISITSAAIASGTAVGRVSIAGAAIAAAGLLSITHPSSVAACRLLSGLVLACIRLPICQRVASSSATVLASRRPVRIWCAPAVLRIVLPTAVTPGGLVGWAVAAIRVVDVLPIDVLPIAIADEVVVVVDVDIVVAAPSASPTRATTPEGSHRDPNTERYGHAGRIVAGGRIGDRGIRINRSPIHNGWVVAGHIDDFWASLLDDDNLLIFDDLGFHFLLFAGLQVSCVLSFLAHALHGVHHVALLRKKSIPKIRRPLDVVSQLLDQVRQSRQGLDAWIPVLF
jgi:hypothetical protein